VPRMKFDPKKVRSSGTDFPTVKMEKKGDHIRLALAEPEPEFAWIHTLRRPKLSPVTGKLIYKTIDVGRGDNKEKKDVPDLDFVGTPICLGNLDVLEETGVDADHCPACKAALDYPDYFYKPERKFAVHVYRYACKGNSPSPVDPLSVTILVWRLSEKRYAKVVSVLEEFAQNGDPMTVDLILGPCENVGYQNYEIAGGSTCYLDQNPEDRKRAERTFESNNAGDLAAYCGRKAEPRFIRNDIQEILEKWKLAISGGQEPEEPDFAGSLADSGSALLESATPAAKAPEAASLDELDDTVGASTEEPAKPAEKPAAPKAAPAAKKAEPAPAATSEKKEFSFASLMDDLGTN
jgi:hypothetical protein